MSRGLAAALGVEALLIAALLTLALDQYAHAQGEPLDGINSWGYRGAVAKQRAYDETRIMMAGGTRAFEPGLPVKDTTVAHVRFMVEQWVTFDRGPVTAINLGLVDLPRSGYADRLQQFRHLAPDVICLYVDLSKKGSVLPAQGLLTRTTGYVPSLPALSAVDRWLGGLFTATQPASDDVSAVKDAALAGVSMAPTVIAIPEPASADEMRERDAVLVALAPLASDTRVKIVQLKDGPPAMIAGVMQPAIAVQIETAVSAFLRARTGSR